MCKECKCAESYVPFTIDKIVPLTSGFCHQWKGHNHCHSMVKWHSEAVHIWYYRPSWATGSQVDSYEPDNAHQALNVSRHAFQVTSCNQFLTSQLHMQIHIYITGTSGHIFYHKERKKTVAELEHSRHSAKRAAAATRDNIVLFEN